MTFGYKGAVDRLTRKIVSQIKSKVPQLPKIRQQLAQMQADVKILKEEFSELDNKCRKTSITQNRIVKAAKSYIHSLDLVIYQNRVINHLDNAEKQMKLFECKVTADKRIVLVVPDSVGTDIDKPVHHSTSQILSLIESEFKRS
jgi:septal ring factor EnvC (AmiA/AmiB activator)